MSTKTVRILIFTASEELPAVLSAFKAASDGLAKFSVDAAHTYGEILSALVNNTHDVYVVSHLLPNCTVSGLELIERANAGGCTRPVVLLADSPDGDLEWAAEEAGAAWLIDKHLDVSPRVLNHVIRFSIYNFTRLKEIQYQLVLVKQQLADVCRKLNRG